jgi:hypothetical protein
MVPFYFLFFSLSLVSFCLLVRLSSCVKSRHRSIMSSSSSSDSKPAPMGLIPKRGDRDKPAVVKSASTEQPKLVGPKKSSKPCRKGGKAAKERRKLKGWKKYKAWIIGQRMHSHLARMPGARLNCVEPKVGAQDSILLGIIDDHSPQTLGFYEEHGLENKLVQVSDRANLSNRDGVAGGGKGLFAIAPIAKDVRVAPYVGEPRTRACRESVGCQYDLRLAPDLVLCAGKELYDMGYLMGWEIATRAVRTMEAPCPPNYARYCNCDGEDPNCAFVVLEDGHDVIFLTTLRDIEEGEELTVDYGNQFIID